jgi:hypothetical protein
VRPNIRRIMGLSVEQTCRYDLFNVRVRVAVFKESSVMYRIRELWEEAARDGGGEAAHTYRGPSLTLLARLDSHTWPELLVLTAPGILEVSLHTVLAIKLASYCALHDVPYCMS